MRRGPIPIHPFLAAAFPVLFLFVGNAADQVTLAPLWLPLAVAIGGATALLIVCRLILGDWLRGAILATVLIGLFFTFGHAWALVGDVLGKRRWLIAAYAAVAILGALVAWRARPARIALLTNIFNVVTGILVAINVVGVVGFAAGGGVATGTASVPDAIPIEVEEGTERPDVYFIVLDRYANEHTLAETYGFDNRPFLDELVEREFAVADDAWSNYFKTAFSLYSMMHMDFIDPEALGTTKNGGFGVVQVAMQQHMRAPDTFKALGYEYIIIPSWWEPAAHNVVADRVLRYAEGSEFADALRQTTALSLLSPATQAPTGTVSHPEPALSRAHTEYQLQALADTASRPGPKLVFVHLLVPHPPYVYDENGNLPSADVANDILGQDEDAYIAQLQWTNDRVLEVVDRLLDVPAEREPVIILTADEGPYPARYNADQHAFEWLEATPEEVQQKFGILTAWHLPNVDPAEFGFNSRTSPVNAFRIVLSAYFGANLPLLPDISWHSPNYERLYDFIPARSPDDP
jgi:Sulfatase